MTEQSILARPGRKIDESQNTPAQKLTDMSADSVAAFDSIGRNLIALSYMGIL